MENDVDIRNGLESEVGLVKKKKDSMRWQHVRRQAHTHKAVVSAYAVTI